jgi:hypothetical protein
VEGIVDVRSAPAAGEPDLLGPQPEPGRLPDQVPVASLGALAVERLLEAEHVTVEAAGGIEIGYLEDEFGDAADREPPAHQGRA